MPSVTEVLGHLTEPELLRWIENNSKAKRKKITDLALRVGTDVDLLVQQDIKDDGYLAPEGDEPVENCLKAWELFKKDHPEFIPSVKEMQTELTHGEIVGHPDFINQGNRGWGITDLKCSKTIWPKYWTQVAQYAHLKLKAGDKFPAFIAILRLDKTTGLYQYEVIDDPQYIGYEWRVFDAYLVAYEHAVKNREIIRQSLEEELLNA